MSGGMRNITEILPSGGSTGKLKSRGLSPFPFEHSWSMRKMPPALCCVPRCSNQTRHKFPKDENLKKAWIIAIRQDKWAPSPFSVVCRAHFMESDYVKSTVHGTNPLIKRLKTDAVPSQFAWTPQATKSVIEGTLTAKGRSSNTSHTEEDDEVFYSADIDVGMGCNQTRIDGGSHSCQRLSEVLQPIWIPVIVSSSVCDCGWY